jgi:hypothetical protein
MEIFCAEAQEMPVLVRSVLRAGREFAAILAGSEPRAATRTTVFRRANEGGDPTYLIDSEAAEPKRLRERDRRLD